MSFSKDNEAYLRSQGYSGTRFDSPRDSDLVEKNKHLYDSIIKYAGDDGELSKDEYEKIYTDRGPWGKYAYNQDSVADAVARAAVDKGFKVNQDTLDRHDLAYDGDDIMSKIYQGDYAPDMKDKDKYSYERSIEENDDAWNVFRYKGGAVTAEPDPVTPDPVDPDPVEPDPVVCTPPQVPDPGGSGTCISPPGQETIPDEEDKNKNKGNDWNIGDDIPEKGNPKSTFPGLNFKDFMQGMGVKLGVSQNPMEQMGSIPYITPGNYFNARSDWQNNTTGYKPQSYQKGKFDTFLKSNKPGDATMMADDLIGNLFRA